MTFVMHRDGEPAIPIPPEVERAAIEAGSDKPVHDYVVDWLKQHPAEAKAAKAAFAAVTPTAAPPAPTPEG